MAIGIHKVQVYKDESSALGGVANVLPGPSPIEPQQDALECAGVFMQDAGARDQTVYIARAGADLIFRDQGNTTPLTLTQLRDGSASRDYKYRRHFLLMGG